MPCCQVAQQKSIQPSARSLHVQIPNGATSDHSKGRIKEAKLVTPSGCHSPPCRLDNRNLWAQMYAKVCKRGQTAFSSTLLWVWNNTTLTGKPCWSFRIITFSLIVLHFDIKRRKWGGEVACFYKPKGRFLPVMSTLKTLFLKIFILEGIKQT